MRKLVVSNFATLDGLFDGPEGDIGPLFRYFHPDYHADPSFDDYNLARLEAADYLLLSRKAFLGNKQYWTGMRGRADVTPVRRAFADLIAERPKLVISDKLEPQELAPWANTEVIPRDDAARRIAALKQEGGGDILVLLSRLLWQDLLGKWLVDEVHVTLFPIVGGTGVPLFAKRPEVPLRLVRSESWPGSGKVLAVYAPDYMLAEAQSD
ncbi:MAG: dihydrofolate reductase family protein [Devosia sp.]|nr:dihydrofolate reductase family protein [Devosia sp.]